MSHKKNRVSITTRSFRWLDSYARKRARTLIEIRVAGLSVRWHRGDPSLGHHTHPIILTTRQVLLIRGIVGLLVSSAVLGLIWFGVAGDLVTELSQTGRHALYAARYVGFPGSVEGVGLLPADPARKHAHIYGCTTCVTDAELFAILESP